MRKERYLEKLEVFELELTNLFHSIDSVKFAYLFGSTVMGDTNELSDVDIAVMLDESLSKKDILLSSAFM